MLRRAALVALAGLAVAAPAAGAHSVQLDSTTIHFIADNSSVTLQYEQNGTDIVLTGATLSSFAPCTDQGSNVYRCPIGSRTRLVLDGGDANDFFFDGPGPLNASLSVTLNGGKGSDTLHGSNVNDTLSGGDGTDTLFGSAGTDTMAGGDGRDRADFSSFNTAVTATVGGTGTVTGGTTTLGADIEDLTGGAGDDTLKGNDGPNTLTGSGGSDTLDGGGGTDTFSAGDGSDTLTARDGQSESVDCGPGTDQATVDSADTPFNCETVDASAALEADGDGDGYAKTVDCADGDAAVHPGAAEVAGNGKDDDCSGTVDDVPDADQDGFLAPFDCNDANASVKPGAAEVKGNGVDEDCDGRAQPFDPLATTLDARWKVRRKTVKVKSLTALGVGGGTTIKVSCRGKRCPFRTKTRKVAKAASKVSLTSLFKHRALPGGVRITVRLSAASRTSRTFRYDTVRGDVPVLTIR